VCKCLATDSPDYDIGGNLESLLNQPYSMDLSAETPLLRIVQIEKAQF
jgi:hypothetical protein